jgi:hypothetical protein
MKTILPTKVRGSVSAGGRVVSAGGGGGAGGGGSEADGELHAAQAAARTSASRVADVVMLTSRMRSLLLPGAGP